MNKCKSTPTKKKKNRRCKLIPDWNSSSMMITRKIKNQILFVYVISVVKKLRDQLSSGKVLKLLVRSWFILIPPVSTFISTRIKCMKLLHNGKSILKEKSWSHAEIFAPSSVLAMNFLQWSHLRLRTFSERKEDWEMLRMMMISSIKRATSLTSLFLIFRFSKANYIRAYRLSKILCSLCFNLEQFIVPPKLSVWINKRVIIC